MKRKLFPVFFSVLTIFLTFCTGSDTRVMEKELLEFITGLEKKIIPLEKDMAEAYFQATVTGNPEKYKMYSDLQFELEKIFTNKDEYEYLKQVQESGLVKDALLKRQLDVLFNKYQSRQIKPEMLEKIINLQTEVEQKFSTYRAEVDGRHYSDNQIDSILRSTVSTSEVKTVWEASKQIGEVVAGDVLELVNMRNQVAEKLGYANYYEMSLVLGEQEPEEVEVLFGELDRLTRKAFAEWKDQIDEYLSNRFSVEKKDLMPWHYLNRFFQEGAQIHEVNLDGFYKDMDIVRVASDYYNGIGLPVDDILSRSDLYEKEGKYQHAYCTDIDRQGDVRIVVNIRPDAYWMNTLLHELGHGVYDRYTDFSLPYLLRGPAHAFTTEAIANMFGRFASNPVWMKDNLDVDESLIDEVGNQIQTNLILNQIVFSRWSQVMFHFEKSLYKNPAQDLNKLWWDLVEEYQLLKKPEGRNKPDWAAKIHIASYPCYYHNYLMGEILASQLYYNIATVIMVNGEVKPLSFNNQPEVGEYLKTNVFEPANRYHWREMIERATGEKLTATYYAEQFSQ